MHDGESELMRRHVINEELRRSVSKANEISLIDEDSVARFEASIDSRFVHKEGCDVIASGILDLARGNEGDANLRHVIDTYFNERDL